MMRALSAVWLSLGAATIVAVVGATLSPFPERANVGGSAMLLADPAATSDLHPTQQVTLAGVDFSVTAANDENVVAAYRQDAVRLYWCDPAKANAELSPNAVRSKVFLRTSGYADFLNTTFPTATLTALGLSPTEAAAAIASPGTARPGLHNAASSIALCGSLGFGAFNNTGPSSVPHAIPSLNITITVTNVQLSSDGTNPVPLGSEQWHTQLFPGTAISVELDENDIWCRAAQTDRFTRRARLSARLTQQLPPMLLRFFDPWGNPAVTSLSDVAKVSFAVPLPRVDLLTTTRDTNTAVPAGSAFAVLPPTAIIGVQTSLSATASAGSPASTLDSIFASSSSGRVLAQSTVAFDRLMQGSRTVRNCGELYLLPGYPQNLAVGPAPTVASNIVAAAVDAQPTYTVAIDPESLGGGVPIRVVPQDSVGNPVAVVNGGLPACTAFDQSDCVACGVPDSPSTVTLLPGTSATVNDTQVPTTWFTLTPASAAASIDVMCWLQLGYTGSTRVLPNATDGTSTTPALAAWTNAGVKTAATFNFQPVGEYACYDGTTPMQEELSAADIRRRIYVS
jgi:hypothetical protein